ncbi:hypothetical protein ACEV6Q_17865 [Enterobacter ludwigii]|uniref:hypothetical protein n=1 Tax=Enterobacter ludwigii TaxID=299767 RepID=UPI003BEF280A
MKKIFIPIVIETIRYTILSFLFWGAITGRDNVVSMASAAIWIIIFLSGFAGTITLLIAIAVERMVKNKQDAIKYLEGVSKRGNIVVRTWGWVVFIATAILLAYSGWVFTAVCYAMTSIFARFCIAIARNSHAEITAPKTTAASS